VKLADGEQYDAETVVSGAPTCRRRCFDLVSPDDLPSALRRPRPRRLHIANGMGMTIRCATDTLPQYPGAPDGGAYRDATDLPLGRLPPPGIQRGHLRPAADKSRARRDDARPAGDPSLALPGKHITVIWAQYHPFTPRAGPRAHGRRSASARRGNSSRHSKPYAPGITGTVTETYMKSPLDLQEENGLIRGHLMHLDMSLDQMFMFRPTAGNWRTTRTPIHGLYPHRREYAPRRRRPLVRPARTPRTVMLARSPGQIATPLGASGRARARRGRLLALIAHRPRLPSEKHNLSRSMVAQAFQPAKPERRPGKACATESGHRARGRMRTRAVVPILGISTHSSAMW